MRRSTYDIILPLMDGEKEIEDRALLVNGLYGAIDVVKKDEAEKFAAGNFAGLPFALKERLMLRGHLTRKDEAGELADLALLSRIYRTIPARSGVGLVIMPTYDCNFRCPYCFEQHRLKKGQSWLDRTMTDEMMDAVFAALSAYRKRGYALNECALYGGEPFLEKNLPVTEKIADRCKALGMKIDAITNGYDLASYIGFMEKYEVEQIQVTVDGTAEINDRRRVHKDGLPTYDRILSNVELALAHGVSVRLRVNVGRENLRSIGSLIDDLKARGFIEKEEKRAAEEAELKKTDKGAKTRRAHFSYYFKAANDDAHPEKNISEQDIVDELMKYGFTAEEAIDRQSQYSVFANGLRRLFQKEEYPPFNAGFCGSEAGMMVVDPFGKVYPCWDAVGKDNDAVGFADPASGRFFWSFAKAKWRTRTVDLMKACQLCPYAFICRGGCASRAMNEHGDYFREYCGETKEIFAFTVSRIAGKEWIQKREDELSLSLAGPVSRMTEAERETIMATASQKEMFEIVKAMGLFQRHSLMTGASSI